MEVEMINQPIIVSTYGLPRGLMALQGLKLRPFQKEKTNKF